MVDEFKELMESMKSTPYQKWVRGEGVPVVEGYGVEDVREMKLGPWRRMGGKGAFINLYGMEGVTGMYVAEIPPGGALEPERHLYEEGICLLNGHGATEVWQDGFPKQTFEWGPWSLFALPLNSWHRLINGSREPVKFWAVTTAPVVMDIYYNLEFVFNCPFRFSDRFAGEEGYFNSTKNYYKSGFHNVWETNFISDVRSAELTASGYKVFRGTSKQFELAGNWLIGHISTWPTGVYLKGRC